MKQGEPIYPRDLKRANRQGTARVEFVIATDGHVDPGRIEIIYNSDPRFGKSALDVVKKRIFEPATYDCKPVGSSARITIPFSIR